MKNKITKVIWLNIIMLATIFASNAQSNTGEIRGKVIDAKTKQGVFGAYVIAKRDGIQADATTTDFDGNYYLKGLDPGNYEVNVTAKISGYNPERRTDIEVISGQTIDLDVGLSKGKSGDKVTKTVKVRVFRDRLIKKDETKTNIGEKTIKELGTRNINAIAGLSAGVNQTSSGVSFRGSREDGTAYYQDGVRLIGNVSGPQASQSQISVIQGGVPAQFGDFTGGAISVTTKGPTRRTNRSLEMISSSPFDAYHYNQFEGFISGPLYMAHKGNKKKERVAIGYMLAGNVRYNKDRAPSAIGVYKVKDDVLRDIEANPLRQLGSSFSFVHRGNDLTRDDLENVKARPNSSSFNGVVQGRLQFVPKKGSVLTAFGSYYRFQGNSATNSIMNYDETNGSVSSTARTFIAFKQKLKDKKREKSDGDKTTIRNAWYNINISYQTSNSESFHHRHKDNYFDYGYVGRFESKSTEFFNYVNNDQARRIIDQNGDTVYVKSYFDHVGYGDTAIRFTATGHNPLRANYTSNLFDETAKRDITLTSDLQINSFGGLTNGFAPPNIYGIYGAPGYMGAGTNYSKGQSERYTVSAMGEAQLIGKSRIIPGTKSRKSATPHDLQFGIMYEQTISRSYGLRSMSLWRLMDQLANRHIDLDLSNPILSYDANGVFQDTIRYNALIQEDQQSEFDKNFRNKLIANGATDAEGKLIDASSRLDINSFAPDDFELSMFSADELLNNGNAYVSYYGYDHTGNKVTGKPSVSKFLNDPNKRTIGAFQPIYTAAWVQDKFEYKDFILRVGLRVERYDANQPVLADPYSLYPIRSAGEVEDLGTHPGNIGDDFKVYVNDQDAPTKILGYRDGSQWYDANGTELSNALPLETGSTSNSVTPYLVDANNQVLTEASFEDYAPTIQVLPRIWFSFPITDEALFFASYDVLAQRPPSGLSRFSIDNYYYMEEKTNVAFANPSLKSRLKTDYEVGFKKKLSEISAISLIASYSEIRNDINQFRFAYAYPLTEGYISYNNIDFSTVKGFRVEYDYRGNGNLSFNANYTLQFANGTGASTASQAALIQAGIDNLRNSLPLGRLDIRHTFKGRITMAFPEKDRKGKDIYNGPIIGKWKILRNAMANVMFTANSGLPYTKIAKPLQIGTVERSTIVGTPYSSRLPWQFNMNLNINKAYTVKLGSKKKGQLNVFFWVTNILNLKNVRGVYPYTGNAEDDGFLNSPQGELVVQNAINAQSFYDIYSIAINSPGNFTAPRQARLGVRLNF